MHLKQETAYKWIKRFKQNGHRCFHKLSRRPHSCPWQTDNAIVRELVEARKAHPSWGPRKLHDLMNKRNPGRDLPSPSTAIRILSREGLVRRRRRHRRAHPGCPKSVPQGSNDIRAADEFRLKNGKYCFPLTVSDHSSRDILGIDSHSVISLEKTFCHFTTVFHTYGLLNCIRTDNGGAVRSVQKEKMEKAIMSKIKKYWSVVSNFITIFEKELSSISEAPHFFTYLISGRPSPGTGTITPLQYQVQCGRARPRP